MRQTNAHWVAAYRGFFLTFFLCILFSVSAFAEEKDKEKEKPKESEKPTEVAFQDLPKDHWAFKDVEYLVSKGYLDGYPDGNFKGRKVVTRYDLALIFARILRKIEEKAKGGQEASDSELASVSRLTREFKDELGLLGVRVDTIERRLGESETKLKTLEGKIPKVNVSGFYRARGQYIFEPSTVFKNEAGDDATFTNPGISALYHKIYLRFTGKPLDEKVEVFYELLGFVSGKEWNKLIYNDYGKAYGPSQFDKIDDYVTKVQNDRYAQTNKAHFVSNAKSMKIRAFAGEAVTGINDPLNILTEDTNIVDPYIGIEFSGTDRGLNYQASVLKRDVNWDNWTKFKDWNTYNNDMVTGRLLWKLPAKFSKDALSLGTSYAEKIVDYKTRGNSNTVRGYDLNYSTERIGKTQATVEFLTSTDYHEDTRDKQKKSLGDEATKFDISIQSGGFTGTAKHYDFGKDFRALMAPIWAYDIGDEDGESHYPYKPIFKDNYKHEGFYGEKLTRFSINYDFGNKLLSIAKNLSVEGTYLSKTWEVDPYAPQKTDGYSGRKYTFNLLSDFTDNTTLKYDYEHKFDALPGEQGAIKNTLELNLKLDDAVSAKGKIWVLNDHDEVDTVDGVTYKKNEQDGYFEVNSNINPRLFAKGSVEHYVKWVNAPKQETRIDYIGEATYNFTPTFSVTGGAQHVDFEKRDNRAKSNVANAILGELKKNFTQKFRGKATYVRAVVDYKDDQTDTVDRENIYGELIYDISKDSSFKLKFGYDYPDDGRWDISNIQKQEDNGRKIETQKTVIFEAKTNF